MTNKGIIKRTLVGTFMSLALTPGFAEQQDNKASSQSNANEALPKADHAARMQADSRVVFIHPEDKTGGGRSKALYFHRPILAFKKNPNKGTDHPIIWEQAPYGSDYMSISLKVVLTTEKFRKLAPFAVKEQDTKLEVTNPELRVDQIVVDRWPIKLLRFDVKQNFPGKNYGSAFDLESLAAAPDVVDVKIKIPSDQYDLFLKDLQKDNIDFVPEYTFSNVITAFAQVSQGFTNSISTKIEDVLENQDLQEGDPIFQSSKRELRTAIRNKVDTVISVTDQSIVEMITVPDISTQLLKTEPTTFEELAKDPDLLSKVEAYLAPTIRKMGYTKVETNRETDTQTSTDEKKLTFKKDPNVVITDKDINKLEKEHKVVVTTSDDKDVIQAQEIEISYIRQGWRENITSAMTQAFIAKGVDKSFKRYTPIPSSFTLARFEAALGNNETLTSIFTNVPKGTVLCGIYDHVPPGWEPLDGTSERKFPDADWVPEKLENSNLPNLSGKFVRGAAGKENIGKEWQDGEITVPSQPIPGDAFSLTKDKDVLALGIPSKLQFPRVGHRIHRSKAKRQDAMPEKLWIGRLTQSNENVDFFQTVHWQLVALKPDSKQSIIPMDGQGRIDSKGENFHYFGSVRTVIKIADNNGIAGNYDTKPVPVDMSKEKHQPPHVQLQCILKMD